MIKRGERRRGARRRHRGVPDPADPRRLHRDARSRDRGRASAERLAAVRRDSRGLRDGRRRGRGAARGLGCGRARAAPTSTAEVLGYGASNDAHHLAQPEPEATGVASMMRSALERAGVEPERVGYINAHGTATPLGDIAETKAIKDVFGDHAYELAVSSTKSMMGHTFGAAGAIEAIMCVARAPRRRPAADDQLPRARPGVRPRLRPERRARGAGRRRALERDGPRRPQRLCPARPSQVARPPVTKLTLRTTLAETCGAAAAFTDR